MKASIQRVIVGFKGVCTEFKGGCRNGMRKMTGQLLTRRENLLVHQMSTTLRKCGLIILFLPLPIVGYLPVVAALSYRKQLLSHHFWDASEKSTYRNEDYDLRCHHGNEVKKHVEKLTGVDVLQLRREEVSQLVKRFDDSGSLSLHAITSEHLRALAGAHNICRFQASYKLMPEWWLRRCLLRRAKFLMEDDHQLHREGIDDLTPEEVVEASFLRTISPKLTFTDMKSELRIWVRNSNEALALNNGAGASLVLHSASLGLYQMKLKDALSMGRKKEDNK